MTKPMYHNYWGCALEPRTKNNCARVPQLMKPFCPRACALQQEKPPQWEARAPKLEKRLPACCNRRKPAQQWTPGTTKINIFLKKRLASNRTRIWNLSSYKTCVVEILNTNKCWWGCGRIGIPIHCWWACKIIRSPWKTVWKFLLRLKCTLTIWLSNIFLCLPQRKEIYIYTKSWTKMLTAVLFIKVQHWKLKLMTGKWNEQIAVYPYNWILLSSENHQASQHGWISKRSQICRKHSVGLPWWLRW